MGGMDGGSDRVAPVLCASPATLPHGWGQVESLRRPLRLHDVICGHTPPLMTSSVVLRSPRHDASLREAGVRPQPHRNGSRQVQHGPCQRALGHRPRRAADATSGQWVLLREASAPRRRSPPSTGSHLIPADLVAPAPSVLAAPDQPVEWLTDRGGCQLAHTSRTNVKKCGGAGAGDQRASTVPAEPASGITGCCRAKVILRCRHSPGVRFGPQQTIRRSRAVPGRHMSHVKHCSESIRTRSLGCWAYPEPVLLTSRYLAGLCVQQSHGRGLQAAWFLPRPGN